MSAERPRPLIGAPGSRHWLREGSGGLAAADRAAVDTLAGTGCKAIFTVPAA